MNISPQLPSLPLATVVNPPTETLRRENNQREVIVKPEAAAQSAAEKGVASEKERAKSPAQNNEQVDFANIRKRAEQENTTISENNREGDNPESKEQQQQQADTEKSAAEIFAEEKIINNLQQRDLEVRSHERAHAAVGGATTGAPSYSFETGPDGKKYASSGEVAVDLSQVKGNPRATIAKMQKVHAAALAPANPSIQDTRVAASAARIIAQAQSELLATDFDDVQKVPLSVKNIKPNDVFSQENGSKNKNDSNDFDTLINQTLDAQEAVSPTRTQDVSERATRIENFYFNINQAYEKPPTHQFELTA
ncbi:MAG: hypothetical protein MJK12_01645 [Colwellia sp.]|nr:hypothetical protein [Colwellia sp.]